MCPCPTTPVDGMPSTLGPLCVAQLARSLLSVADIPSAPNEFINQDLIAQLFPALEQGLAPSFTGTWLPTAIFLTLQRWIESRHWQPSDDRHRPITNLAIAVLFIIAGAPYRQPKNWGIGHSLKEILEGPRKGDFPAVPRSEGHEWFCSSS